VARLASEQKLAELGPRLLELVRDGNLEPAERFYALQALAEFKPQGAAQMVVARLSQAPKEERMELLKALPGLGDRTVVPELVPLLGDADNQVVSHAVYALENLTGQRLGPDVQAWRKYAGLDPSGRKAPSAAQPVGPAAHPPAGAPPTR
jgi:HEAT repeat protein